MIKPEIIHNNTTKKSVDLSIRLPEHPMEQSADVYDVFINKRKNDTVIKKRVIAVGKREVSIKRNQRNGYEYNCVMVHGKSNSVLCIRLGSIK